MKKYTIQEVRNKLYKDIKKSGNPLIARMFLGKNVMFVKPVGIKKLGMLDFLVEMKEIDMYVID